MSTLLDEIAKVQDETMRRIADAATQHDVKLLGILAPRTAKLEEMKRTVVAIEAALTEFRTSFAAGTGKQLRRLEIRVSEGMIRQNLLTFTPHIKQGHIEIGEEMAIQATPGGTRFTSRVLENGNRLQERGEIGRFYHTAGVHEGDFVVLTETKPSEWTLEKKQP